MLTPVRRALLSVSDKTGIVEFARELQRTRHRAAVDRRHRQAAGSVTASCVKEVAEHTGFPEIMGGRVKTLHPKIHGGLLGRRGVDEAVMSSTTSSPSICWPSISIPSPPRWRAPTASYEDAVDNIDIGGPAMVRAAAKNHASVTVVVDPGDYRALLDELAANQGATNEAMRQPPRRQGIRPHGAIRRHGIGLLHRRGRRRGADLPG